jgi:hypothetical protein
MKKIFSSLSHYSVLVAGAASALWLIATPAQAAVFGFDNISHNNAINEAFGESQLSFDVTDAKGGEDFSSSQVLFKFNNKGTAASSITQIYFDHNPLAPLLKSVSSIIASGSGVSFSKAEGNLNLPAGNNVNFTSDFGVKAKTPVSQKGVNPGEYVSVLFDLQNGIKLENIFDALTTNALRIGFHVQAFKNGGSEAFVNNPVAIAPVQTTTPTTPTTSETPTTPTTPTTTTPPRLVQSGSTTYDPSSLFPPETKKVPEPATILALGLFGATSWKLKKKK